MFRNVPERRVGEVGDRVKDARMAAARMSASNSNVSAAPMLKTYYIETVSKHLCVDQKTSCICVKAPGSSLSALWRQTLTHGIPALALVAGVRLLHSRDVTSTFTDFTNPSFTVCFDDNSGFFSLECTDNGRDVGPDHIELHVLACGTAASDPVLCGCARPVGNFPNMPPPSYAFA
ncbi:hypothetical protein Q7P35_004417 [Cladosporium inversicolor]